MGEYVAEMDLCTIPDGLTVPQFILDSGHPTRPIRKERIPWLIDDTTGQKIGFEEIRSRVFGLANALSVKLNIRENDVVCIFSQNDVDYPIIVWAIHRLGAIVATVNPGSNAEELAYHLHISEAMSLVAHPDVLHVATKAAEQSGISPDRLVLLGTSERVTPNFSGYNLPGLIEFGLIQEAKFVECRLEPGKAKTRVAFLLFSSGTTGKPKAVEIPHYAVIANIIQLSVFLRTNDGSVPWEKRRLRPGHVALCVLPLYHVYGMVACLHFQLYCGLTVVIAPKFDFVRFLKSIILYRVTHLMVVPPMAVLLAKHPATKNYDISHVRFLACGAAPVSGELQEQVMKVIPNAEIGQTYGMTEACTVISLFPLSQRIGTPGSAGVFIPGVRARIMKPDGTLAKPGEQGELYVTGPSMALGYYKNEKATNETFIGGWVRTGDEAMLNDKNELFVLDRVKEILKVRAFQVAPAELEGHLLRHPDVADVCVVGVPDEYSGELPFAFVVLSANAARRAASGDTENIKASIIKHVADKKAKHKHLQGGIEFISTIPRNPSGKLLRRILREQAKQLKAKRAKAPATTAKL